MKILGIDPGSDGGLCILEDGVIIKTMSTPNFKDCNGNKIIDTYKVGDFISENEVDHIFIEDVHAIYGISAKNTFNFGRNVGMIEGLILAFGYELNKVKPKVWQLKPWRSVPMIKDENGKKDNKIRSLLALKKLFPNISEEILLRTPRCKKPHDGIVDSILIAYYGNSVCN
tara:strand:+ start:41068 stop:41580 length:513 start_codon:yes stop_codon:yes gene_type:complete